jgi:hypothetical protein
MNAWTVVIMSRKNMEEATVYCTDRQPEATRAAKLIMSGGDCRLILRATVRSQEIDEATMKARWIDQGRRDGQEGAPCPCVARTWRNEYWNAYRVAQFARQRQESDCEGK